MSCSLVSRELPLPLSSDLPRYTNSHPATSSPPCSASQTFIWSPPTASSNLFTSTTFLASLVSLALRKESGRVPCRCRQLTFTSTSGGWLVWEVGMRKGAPEDANVSKIADFPQSVLLNGMEV